MAKSRRNFYRILYLQPEAPPEVIRAAYRALMQTLRAHPDLGGGHEEAALINEAYAVLKDPERRQAYDKALLPVVRRARAGSLSGRAGDPDGARAGDSQARTGPGGAANACPFCLERLSSKIDARVRCARCASPLSPPPAFATGREVVGRRNALRFTKNQEVKVQLAWRGALHRAWLRDMSVGGLSLCVPAELRERQIIRVLAPGFEALASVVRQRQEQAQFVVHARLLTLARTARTGMFVQTSA